MMTKIRIEKLLRPLNANRIFSACCVLIILICMSYNVSGLVVKEIHSTQNLIYSAKSLAESSAMNAKLAALSAAEEKRWIQDRLDKLKEEEIRMAKFIQDNALFLKKAKDIRETIDLTMQLICFSKEILTLKQGLQNRNMSNCLVDFETKISQVRIQSNILQLTYLVEGILETSGLDKSAKFAETTSDLMEMYEILKAQRAHLIREIKRTAQSEERRSQLIAEIDAMSGRFNSLKLK